MIEVLRRGRDRGILGTGAIAMAVALSAPNGLEAQATEPPAPLPERPLEFPAFQEAALDNGLDLIVLEHRAQPVASARLYLPAGSGQDPPGKEGLASMTASVLTQGTEMRSAREIAETIEGVGGSLNASAGRDFLTISVSTLAEDLELGMELLADVALNPTFPEDEVELDRRRTLSSLQAQRAQPQQVAVRHFFQRIYGDEHPYGPSPRPETVQALSREDLVEFHREHVRPGRALLVVAGDVDPEEIETLAQRYLGEWEGDAPPPADVPPPAERDGTRIYLVDRPGSVQATIAVGQVGPTPDHPDFLALQVLNRVLGGGVDSRLFRILREEKGWTYGSFSQLGERVHSGFLVASADVRTEVTDSTVVEMLHQLDRIREEPLPEEEVDQAISYLAGSFPLRIETASQIAGQIAENHLLGLPRERLTAYRERIREVRPEDLQRAAREHLTTDRLAVVVVGDAEELLPKLEEVGEVRVYDVDGEPLAREDVLRQEGESDGVAPARDGELLQAMVREYDVLMGGEDAGVLTYTLEREGDHWVARAEMDSEFMTQDQELRFGAQRIEAVSLLQESIQQGVEVSADLRVEDGRLLGQAGLPPQAGGDREFDHPFPSEGILPGMDEYVLAASPLTEGASFELPVFDLLAGEVSPVAFQVVGEEEVTVAAGSFQAYRVEVQGGPAPLTLHLRKEAPHLLLKQEYQGTPLTVELRSVH